MENRKLELETQNVQQVYDEIAEHFSATRYKPWPVVRRFVEARAKGSLGLDVGCGNGKNMTICPMEGVLTVGLDFSAGLLRICQDRGLPVVLGSMLNLPFRSACFDFILSIAALHHLCNPKRRLAAMQEMCRTLKVGGEMLIIVLALEQPTDSWLHRRKLVYLSDDQQDVLVPWTANDGKIESTLHPHMRYYHLFRKGELDELLNQCAGMEAVQGGYDQGNWFLCIRRLA